jgi:hypothetical protein
VREKIRELTPRDVSGTLGEAMVVHHPLNRQLLNRDQIKLVNDAAAVLVSKIASPPSDTLSDACNHLTPFGVLQRTMLRIAQMALRLD